MCSGNWVRIGGRSGVVGFASWSTTSSLEEFAFRVSMVLSYESSKLSSKAVRAGVSGSWTPFASSMAEPAKDGARVELARDRLCS